MIFPFLFKRFSFGKIKTLNIISNETQWCYKLLFLPFILSPMFNTLKGDPK